MTPLEDAGAVEADDVDDAVPAPDAGQYRVAANARLTALASGTLLVLLVVELLTVAAIHALISVHIVVGVLLVGPLVIKLASTGSRFVRYYTGSPAFVAEGPPRRALRLLAPLLVLTTLSLVGSGIGLAVTGPAPESALIRLHVASFLIWLPLVAVHAVAYLRRLPGLIAGDWRGERVAAAAGRAWRLGLVLGALLIAAVGAVLLLPVAAPWIPWGQGNQEVPGPFVAGVLVTILALLAIRPLRWG